MTPPRTPTHCVRTQSRTARSSDPHRQDGTQTAPEPDPAARSQSNTAGHPAAGVPPPELRPGTSQTRHQRATPTSEPLRKQQCCKQEQGQQHRDHQAHGVLRVHRRCPARTVNVKITNASTVKTTKTTSGTRGSDRYDSDPHGFYPTTGYGTRQGLFTRPLREAVQNSPYFYAGHRPYSMRRIGSFSSLDHPT